ncbi:MAG: hypothetical protein U0231_16580 [Nitrospiraceae bacterium]
MVITTGGDRPAMKDPAFGAQLFRFADSPALSDKHAGRATGRGVLRRCESAYLRPAVGYEGLSATSLKGPTLTGKTIRHQVEQMARTFIAGDKVTTALPALEPQDGDQYLLGRSPRRSHGQ